MNGKSNFGPWATTLDTGPGVRLTTFWQRRMAMLPTLNGARAHFSWIPRTLVTLGALAVLTLPAVYLSTAASAEEHPQRKTAQPNVEYLPRLTKGELRIFQTLEEPTTMDFTETPLQDAVDYLADFHGIPIQVDNRALEDAGLGSDLPLTRQVRDVSLKSGLRLLLRPKDLTFLTHHEVLLITTEDAAESMLITRTYPVTDLLDENSGEVLTEAITTTVLPQTWHEVGGNGSIAYVPSAKSLVISQTHGAHDEILELLRALRTVRETETGKSGPKGNF